jgi:hypothetical protein
MRERLREMLELARTYGARGVARRTVHEVRRRAGRYGDEEAWGEAAVWRKLRVDVEGARRVMAGEREKIVEEAEAVLAGRMRFFGGEVMEVGWTPRWHRHVISGEAWPREVPWSESAKGKGDIKWVWEPSRFGWVWAMTRAWAVSGEERFREGVWRGVADWMEKNPPGRGVNWYCAQELTFRCMAMVFAGSVMPGGEEMVGKMVRVAARRIERTLGHGLSQRNNHGLSEAIGLWTLSVMAPEEEGAERRRERAVKAMRECLADQFAEDGAYIQESLNYHRLAVQVLLWARWVARSVDVALPEEVAGALKRSSGFLRGVIAPGATGWPVYGHEDGADVLPLARHEHRDVRPVMVHLARELGEAAPFEAGPCDEEAAWCGLAEGKRVRSEADGLRVTSSGYVSSTRGAWMVFSRVPRHRDHRPAHADALHVDVWWRGRNVALDPGTYSYVDNALAETRVHNTCSVGERSQMRRRGKFLWTRWSEAVMERQEDRDGASLWVASVRPAWGREARHRRVVRHDARQIDVVDVVEAEEVIRLRWNLDGTEWRRRGGSTSWEGGGVIVTIASEGAEVRETSGWASPTYGLRVPCTVIELESPARRVWFRTTFHVAGEMPEALPDEVQAMITPGRR